MSMADYEAGEHLKEDYLKAMEDYRKGRIILQEAKSEVTRNVMYTERVLNDNQKWVDGNGEVHILEEMEEGYLRNVLGFLHKNRHRYWLNCKNANLIEAFSDGDEFFQQVIRVSPLWKAIILLLTEEEELKFNFKFDLGNK